MFVILNGLGGAAAVAAAVASATPATAAPRMAPMCLFIAIAPCLAFAHLRPTSHPFVRGRQQANSFDMNGNGQYCKCHGADHDEAGLAVEFKHVVHHAALVSLDHGA